MKYATFGAIGLLVVSAGFALPTHRELPENIAFLSVCERTENAFAAKLREIWRRPGAATFSGNLVSAEEASSAKAQLEAMGIPEILRRMESFTLGATRNAKNLPDGFILLIDGDFDAPAFMRRLIASEPLQQALKSEGNGFTVKTAGEAVLITVPSPGSDYPPLEKGGELRIEAVAPHALRMASAGTRAALTAGKTLPPKSVYAQLLVPGGLPQRVQIEDFNLLFSALGELIPPKARSELSENPLWQTFAAISKVEWASRALPDTELQRAITFHLASPEAVEALHELLIGGKVLARSLLTDDMPFEVKEAVNKIKITSRENRVTLSLAASAQDTALLYNALGMRLLGIDERGIEMLTGMEPALFCTFPLFMGLSRSVAVTTPARIE